MANRKKVGDLLFQELNPFFQKQNFILHFISGQFLHKKKELHEWQQIIILDIVCDI